jgi:hypothetical protein
MPVDLNLLSNPINRCILAQAGETVGAALARLDQAKGETWWHLVVERQGVTLPVQILSPLAQSEGASSSSVHLATGRISKFR